MYLMLRYSRKASKKEGVSAILGDPFFSIYNPVLSFSVQLDRG